MAFVDRLRVWKRLSVFGYRLSRQKMSRFVSEYQTPKTEYRLVTIPATQPKDVSYQLLTCCEVLNQEV